MKTGFLAPAYAIHFTILRCVPDSLVLEAEGLVRRRLREGEPRDVALGLGLLGFPRNTGIS